MNPTLQVVFVTLLVLASGVWIGGIVTIVVVARAAKSSLEPAARVALFSALGKTYLGVGVGALLVAFATGGALLVQRGWDGVATSAALLAGSLVVVLAVAVAQARRMSDLRRQAVEATADAGLQEQIRLGGRSASALRGLLGLVSLALVVLGARLAL